MRLIAADELKTQLYESIMVNEDMDCLDFLRVASLIDAQPTAYDVDKVVEELKQRSKEYNSGGITNMSEYSKSIVQQVAEEYNNGWIPVKTRPMTEEEKEYYSEFLFEGNGIIYECTLPDDGQEVLITSKFGSVDKTTFYTDCGNYFENYEDYDDVLAWQPLPEPYQPKDS